MAIDMSQFYQVFFEESAEHLATMEALLLDLDVEHPDAEQLNAIFRAAHSIKGSAGTFGFTDMAETTHILENLLDRIRKQELALSPEMVDAFLEAGDLLRGMLEAHQGQGAVDVAAVAAIGTRLRALSSGEPERREKPAAAITTPRVDQPAGARAGETQVFAIEFVPTVASASGGGVDRLLEELAGFGELEIVCRPDGDSASVGFWQLRLKTSTERQLLADHVDFIADHGAWRVEEEKKRGSPPAAPFGFFADAPGAPDENPGFGFFAPRDEADLPEPPAPDAAYGFFEPLPDKAAARPESPAEEGEGYGFFAPLPVAPPPVAEEGDGYGFFAPLPELAKPSSVVPKVEADTSASAETSSAVKSRKPAATADSSIRVSVEKVDQLINLVGELVITQSMLLQTTGSMPDGIPERLQQGLLQLERNTRDLQESVMSIRMLPISVVFSRFPRVIRDLSAKLGKQVELKTSGETTELDKGLIERIADPLTHLIRNSLDHGIETTEQRISAGKAPVGTITLKAYHQGGNIVIEVGDDGAGLPRQKILAKARERGLPVSDQMSDQEVFSLIFEAGFSTADQVTDVSGRGVGMDVVRRNIQEMGGRVEIESMLGIGTRMTVRLPLTLAILDGMSVAVGSQTYILPLSYVIESLQPQDNEIKTLANQGRVVQVRGEYLPVIVLHEAFNQKPATPDLEQGIMIIIDADGTRAALFVDALVGQHQVVIKSLEANYRRVPGISGATIMGDGRVALILDVSTIAAMARSTVRKAG